MDLSENAAIGGAVMDVILWPVCLFWRTLSYTYTHSNMLAAHSSAVSCSSIITASLHSLAAPVLLQIIYKTNDMLLFFSEGAQVHPVRFCIAELDTMIKIHYYPSLLQVAVCFFLFCLDMEQSILFNRRIPFVENFIWV